jgi:glycosyltransferase involved in cell wall biosynthesis
MAAALKLADVVVLPTHEPLGFQRLLAEAQAMGRPAIVSAVGGAVEQVSDGETGFLVAPGAADALAVALRHALCLSSLERQRLSVNSIFQARKHYDRKQTIEQTLQIYRDLLQRQS